MDFPTVKNLFPLKLVSARLDGYYMAACGDIYSTRISAHDPRRLAGSASHTRTRHYTLAGLSWNGQSLHRRAQNHSEWLKHTGQEPKKVAKSLKAENEWPFPTDNTTLIDKVKGRGWVIASILPDGNKLLFGSEPKIHQTELLADTELSRLACASPGTIFVKLRIVDAVIFGGLTHV